MLEPPDPMNGSYQRIQRMEERIQNIEDLAKRSLIAQEQATTVGDQDQQENDDIERKKKRVHSPVSEAAPSRSNLNSPRGERTRKPPVPKLASYQKIHSPRSETVSPDQLKSKYNALKQQVKLLQKQLDHARAEKKTNKI